MSYLNPPPGNGLLAIGVVLPVLAILIELVTGMCADIFFDPLPSWGHVALVAAAPAVNYALWTLARREVPAPAWLAILAGAALAIGGLYALMFLPLMPIALIGIIIGLGVLPMAPALALLATVKLLGRIEVERPLRRLGGGIALGLAALVAVEIPAAATQLALNWQSGSESDARRGVALMRAAGDEDMLLGLCYGEAGRAAGPVGLILATWNEGLFGPAVVGTSSAARELYFRSTGRAFNAAEPPSGRSSRFAWDEDVGGESVGGHAPGVTLAQSRIDGSVSAADNLAYLEWTAVFANSSPVQREARLSLALPEGAVASRATLWVNGEPREASVAGRAAARAAYESVVRVQRDPLLVTTDGAGRLLVQAFPIQPESTLKLRIGLTAPLAVAPDGRRSLALPAIAERNFTAAPDLRHLVWIEGEGIAGASGAAFQQSRLPGGAVRLRAALDAGSLADHRPRILVARATQASIRTGLVPAAGKKPPLGVRQTLSVAPVERPSALTIVFDGSASNREAARALAKALPQLPQGLPVSLSIASEPSRSVPAAPWSPSQRSRFEEALNETPFAGGEDNLPALAEALEAAAGNPSARLLWIHGPQPVSFLRSRGRVEQILERGEVLPGLVRYQAEPGPAFTINGSPWFDSARSVAGSGDAAADLAGLFAEFGGGAQWQVKREAAPAPAAGSPHIARLWAAEELARASAATGKPREEGIALAHRLNIVTPLSGAVVLETDRNYDENGLPVPNAEDVPTVPEPGTWALIAIAAGLLLWLARRRRREAFA